MIRYVYSYTYFITNEYMTMGEREGKREREREGELVEERGEERESIACKDVNSFLFYFRNSCSEYLLLVEPPVPPAPFKLR